MFKKILSKSLAAFLAVLMVVSCVGLSVFAEELEPGAEPDAASEDAALTAEEAAQSQSKLEKIKELLSANSYAEYSLLHTDAPEGTDDVTIAGAD
ncbi:MAG: hypothetical protein J6Z79_07065, partial [Clostridia bacterium]|nr:hypothetical protein [Clostridia bacterium]